MTRTNSSFRVVLDTNVLLRALVNHSSRSRDVVTACEERRAIALLSKPILDEYRRVFVHLQQLDESITAFEIQAELRKLRYFGEYVRQVSTKFPFPRDPTDAKLIELAIEAGATHIVTYDADLLSLPTARNEAGKRFRQRLRGVLVVRPDKLIRENPELLALP